MKLQDPDLGDSVSERTNLIGQVINKVGMIDFKLNDAQFDVLGTAYMILIGLFASDAGKKGGEFFTPTGPSKLCATLASMGLAEARTVGDCTCGSASMLLEVQKHLSSGRVGHFYGQEKNASTYNLARMNMLMHGVDYHSFSIYKGDTLTTDYYDEEKMTVQVCNPPYSLKWSADPSFEDDPRYSGAGKLAPKSHADYAFLEHMIYHMDPDDGRIAVLLPHGVLFRGAAEEQIRKYIVRDLNRLDAVIGLPANLFHGTGIPVCLLVLKTNRNGNSGNILFIDASKEFKPGKNMNTLEEEHISKIVEAYRDRQDIEKFCHVATMKEIVENDYNLNIPRYVDTSEKEEEIDLAVQAQTIESINTEISSAETELKQYFVELGLKSPF
jgi:type I restriction enzyme M protein